MGTIMRLVIGIPIAAIITVILFLVMTELIRTDEVIVEEEVDDLEFSINDEVAEIEARRRDTTIEDVQQVQPPPPPPQICLLYTSPSPRDLSTSRMPSSA